MTQSTNVAALDHSIEKTNRWLKELSAELQVDRDEFIEMFRQRAALDAQGVDAVMAAKVATNELRRHITEGEMEDVYAQLPNDVREVIEAV